MQIRTLLCVSISILAGCASAPTEGTKADAEPQNCGHEYQTGSNLPMKRCKAPASAAERQRTIEEIRDGIDTLSAKPIGTGG